MFKEMCKNWFTNRVVDEYKKLSSHVISTNMIESFKYGLPRFMDGEENNVITFPGAAMRTVLLWSPYILVCPYLEWSNYFSHSKGGSSRAKNKNWNQKAH